MTNFVSRRRFELALEEFTRGIGTTMSKEWDPTLRGDAYRFELDPELSVTLVESHGAWWAVTWFRGEPAGPRDLGLPTTAEVEDVALAVMYTIAVTGLLRTAGVRDGELMRARIYPHAWWPLLEQRTTNAAMFVLVAAGGGAPIGYESQVIAGNLWRELVTEWRGLAAWAG